MSDPSTSAGAADTSVKSRKRASRQSIAFAPSAGENKENGGEVKSRKLRSKSLMPGELKPAGREHRASQLFGEGSAAPRSILKPTIPLSPLQQIPTHQSAKQSNTTAGVVVPLKTEEEQQLEREQREAERTIALKHRAERRKSLGGRRVSFHPEVTLHVLEEVKTPSSNGTEKKSNRRSSLARQKPEQTPTPAAAPEPIAEDPPSTPPRQIEEEARSPESARQEHRKINRRSSLGATATATNNGEVTEDLLQLSPTPSSIPSSPGVPDDDSVLAPDNSDEEDETGVIAASPSVTMHSDLSDEDLISDRESSPSDGAEIEITGAFKPWVIKPHSHPRLSHPETGFTSAPESERSPPKKIQPWIGKSHDHPRLSHPETGFSSAPPRSLELLENMQEQDDDGDISMEITRAVGPGLIQSPTPTPNQDDDDDDDAMEVTKVIGRGILSKNRESLYPQLPPMPAAENDDDDDDDAMEVTKVIGRGILSRNRESLAPRSAPTPASDDEEMTMEITRVVGPGLLPQAPRNLMDDDDDDDGEQTMDITRVIGPGLLAQTRSGPSRRSSAISRRVSAMTNIDNDDEEQTMEITRAIGGIHNWKDDQDLEDEEMSMELTKVVGGFLNRPGNQASRKSINQIEEEVDSDGDEGSEMEVDMEVTRPIGGIISDNSTRQNPRNSRRSTIAERTEVSSIFEEADLNGVTMNVTGGLPILPTKRNTSSPVGRDLPVATRSQSRSPTKANRSPAATASPAPRALGRVTRSRTSTTPKRDATPKASTPKASTPKASTPKTATPKAATPKAATPKGATPSRPVQTTPQTTPKKMMGSPAKAQLSTPQRTTATAEDPEASLPGFGHGLSAKRRIAGNSSVKSTPQRPKAIDSNVSPTPNKIATGVGISRPGLGSPAISKILKSRRSLGEDTVTAEAFSPGVKSFATILNEVREDKKDNEKFFEEEKRLSKEAEKTASIREVINMLTPRKEIPAKKKSPSPDLAGSKRTFGQVQEDLKAVAVSASPAVASPVRKKRRSLTGAEPVAPPPPPPQPILEQPQEKTTQSVKFATSPGQAESAQDDEEDSQSEEPAPVISMKEFLSMINISFQDHFNSTTLRRQTGAFTPHGAGLGRESLPSDEEVGLIDKIIAKNITCPNLALMQFATKALKKDISGGRAIAKKIEKEVQKTNPLLFKEYMYSPADVRATMDRQFGDIKAHCRLFARKTWYEWRANLLQGLLEQVPKNHLEPLKADDALLQKQKSMVDQILPGLEEKHKALEAKAVVLRERNEDVSSCDQNELSDARAKLAQTLKTIEEKKLELQKAAQRSNELDQTIVQREERKATLLSEIEDAEKVKEANRGFSVEEVMQYKRQVEALEKKYKWSIVKVVAPEGLRMRYNDEIDVVLSPMDPNGKREISYHLENPSMQVQYFFNKLAAAFKEIKVNDARELLAFVKTKWEKSRGIIEQLRKLELHYQMQFAEKEDGKLVATVTLIVVNRKAKIFVYIALDGLKNTPPEITTEVVYGQNMKGWKLDDYLTQVTADGSTTWKDAFQQLVRELEAVPSSK